MSDCNYCKWQRMKRRGDRRANAAQREALWPVEGEFAERFGGGVVIVNKSGEFVSWFMELPERCAC